MNETKNNIEQLTKDLGHLLNDYKTLLSIRIAESGSLGLSISITGLMVLIFVSLILFFFSLGIAWWLGEYLDNMKSGFFIISAFYIIILLALLLTIRKVWVPGIRNIIIRKIYDQY